MGQSLRAQTALTTPNMVAHNTLTPLPQDLTTFLATTDTTCIYGTNMDSGKYSWR